MYVLEEDGIKGVCVVIDAGYNVLEIKNIAILPQCHGKGYGRLL
ncbi:GNAT family N-acetyltransferase [Eubacterium xylanophilum]